MVVQDAGEGVNVYSTPNINWEPLDSFESGQVLEMNVVVNDNKKVKEIT